MLYVCVLMRVNITHTCPKGTIPLSTTHPDISTGCLDTFEGLKPDARLHASHTPPLPHNLQVCTRAPFAHTHTHTHTYIYTHLHTHTHTHTHTHPHTHTHTHTHTMKVMFHEIVAKGKRGKK